MCYTSNYPINSTWDGSCCFTDDACAKYVCGAQNSTIIYGQSEYGGDIVCLLNYTGPDQMWTGNNNTNCGGTGCLWKDGVEGDNGRGTGHLGFDIVLSGAGAQDALLTQTV
ncbi:hypothetical protein I350_07228 [Cryptococcus amylolentus CBS 6273]|uniref:Uncharacterized protein n=1 Tax=Cryptococcus amylolentus CBS 6273 TaxID=1296118 RepID=A0A1E3JDX2_9TREE|nr:hypothetical protein I350_07228 [Cryptococcus amylolentus CBS 6273]